VIDVNQPGSVSPTIIGGREKGGRVRPFTSMLGMLFY
jgi:hypothetical protein